MNSCGDVICTDLFSTLISASRFEPVSYQPVCPPVDGFTEPKSVVQIKRTYPPPPLPPGFRPFHRFTNKAPKPGSVPQQITDPVAKGLMLGEKIGT